MSSARDNSQSAARCIQTEAAGNLRPCGCARRYLPSAPPQLNGPGRSRSSTNSSIKSRSRTPSNHPSSGRTTPSPTPGCSARMGLGERTQSESALLDLQEEPKLSQKRFVSTCQLKPKGMSAVYTTTVLIRIGSSSRRHLIDEIKYEMKLTPQKQQKDSTRSENHTPNEKQSKQRLLRTEFEVELQRPSQDTTLIRIHRPATSTVTMHNKEKSEKPVDDLVDNDIPEQQDEEGEEEEAENGNNEP